MAAILHDKIRQLLNSESVDEIVPVLLKVAEIEKEMVRTGEIPNFNNINVDSTFVLNSDIKKSMTPDSVSIPPMSDDFKEASVISSVDISKEGYSSSSLSSTNSEGEDAVTDLQRPYSRGRKRMYTDDERRRRKNYSSKLSRDKHSKRVKRNQIRLRRLQTSYEYEKSRQAEQLEKIKEKRKLLCPSCSNLLEVALERLQSGEHFLNIKWNANHCTGGRTHQEFHHPVVIKQEIIESEVQYC